MEDYNAYPQSGAADDVAVYPHDGGAKDDGAYRHAVWPKTMARPKKTAPITVVVRQTTTPRNATSETQIQLIVTFRLQPLWLQRPLQLCNQFCES
jgi:hypothetical protein